MAESNALAVCRVAGGEGRIEELRQIMRDHRPAEFVRFVLRHKQILSSARQLSEKTLSRFVLSGDVQAMLADGLQYGVNAHELLAVAIWDLVDGMPAPGPDIVGTVDDWEKHTAHLESLRADLVDVKTKREQVTAAYAARIKADADLMAELHS